MIKIRQELNILQLHEKNSKGSLFSELTDGWATLKCARGGHNLWLSCADWSHRAQLVLGFHPSSWAWEFCGPLWKRIVKYSPSARPQGPCWAETPLLLTLKKTTGRQIAAGWLWEILATGEHSTSVKENIWQVTWKVLKKCGNSGRCQNGWNVWLKQWEEIKDTNVFSSGRFLTGEAFHLPHSGSGL